MCARCAELFPFKDDPDLAESPKLKKHAMAVMNTVDALPCLTPQGRASRGAAPRESPRATTSVLFTLGRSMPQSRAWRTSASSFPSCRRALCQRLARRMCLISVPTVAIVRLYLYAHVGRVWRCKYQPGSGVWGSFCVRTEPSSVTTTCAGAGQAARWIRCAACALRRGVLS